MKLFILLSLLVFNAYGRTLYCRGPLGSHYVQDSMYPEYPIFILHTLHYATKKAGDFGIHLPEGHCAYRRNPVANISQNGGLDFRLDEGYWSRDVTTAINQCAANSRCVLQINTTTSTVPGAGLSVDGINSVLFHRPLKFVPLLSAAPVTMIPVSITPAKPKK